MHSVIIIPVLLSVIILCEYFLRLNSVLREMLEVSSLLVLEVRMKTFLTHVICLC